MPYTYGTVEYNIQAATTSHNLFAQFPPEKTVEGALDFVLKLLSLLEGRPGLLLKPAGENIVPFKGQMVSAGRVCFPNGDVWKVLTDVPNYTNGASWNYDGVVAPDRYLEVPEAQWEPDSGEEISADIPSILAAILETQRTQVEKLDTIIREMNPDLGAPIPSIPALGVEGGKLVLKPLPKGHD